MMWNWTSLQNIPALLIVTNFNLMWTALYIMVIRRGVLDKTYGIPIAALFLNAGWDFVSVFIFPQPMPQNLVLVFYLLLEIGIFYTVLRFWRNEHPGVPPGQFYFLFILGLGLALSLLIAFSVDFNETPAWRSGYLDTFINSALFIPMLYRRPDLRGQTIYIGLAKLIGSAPLAFAFYLHPWPGFEGSVLLPVLYLGIFVLDLAYVVLFYMRSKAAGINPWKRI